MEKEEGTPLAGIQVPSAIPEVDAIVTSPKRRDVMELGNSLGLNPGPPMNDKEDQYIQDLETARQLSTNLECQGGASSNRTELEKVQDSPKNFMEEDLVEDWESQTRQPSIQTQNLVQKERVKISPQLHSNDHQKLLHTGQDRQFSAVHGKPSQQDENIDQDGNLSSQGYAEGGHKFIFRDIGNQIRHKKTTGPMSQAGKARPSLKIASKPVRQMQPQRTLEQGNNSQQATVQERVSAVEQIQVAQPVRQFPPQQMQPVQDFVLGQAQQQYQNAATLPYGLGQNLPRYYPLQPGGQAQRFQQQVAPLQQGYIPLSEYQHPQGPQIQNYPTQNQWQSNPDWSANSGRVNNNQGVPYQQTGHQSWGAREEEGANWEICGTPKRIDDKGNLKQLIPPQFCLVTNSELSRMRLGTAGHVNQLAHGGQLHLKVIQIYLHRVLSIRNHVEDGAREMFKARIPDCLRNQFRSILDELFLAVEEMDALYKTMDMPFQNVHLSVVQEFATSDKRGRLLGDELELFNSIKKNNKEINDAKRKREAEEGANFYKPYRVRPSQEGPFAGKCNTCYQIGHKAHQCMDDRASRGRGRGGRGRGGRGRGAYPQ